MTHNLRSICAVLFIVASTNVSAGTKPPKAAPTLSDSDIALSASNLVVRLDPKYPPQAARDGLDGWVMLSYTIGTDGRVSDITILDASPQRLFDREARKALAKWRYKPLIKDGQPQNIPNVKVVLEFELIN